MRRARVVSTQRLAVELASRDAPEGTVVVARTQSEGRGRMGRSWLSPEGGLYLSIVLRPGSTRRLQVLPLIAAFAVLDAIAETTGLSPRVRWPNDVTIGGKKVSGTIAESDFRKGLSYVVLGIGINCNTTRHALGGLQGEATSLLIESGRKVGLKELEDRLFRRFGLAYGRWEDGEDLINGRKADLSTIGKKVTLLMKSGMSLSGVATGLSPSGRLRVSVGGKEMAVGAEEVERLREESGSR